MTTTLPDAFPTGGQDLLVAAVSPVVPESDQLTFLARRALIAGEEVETALLLLCGELTGLTVNENLFRARIPAGVGAASAVALTEELPCADPRFRVWRARFTARSPEGAGEPALSRLAGKLPLPGWTRVSSVSSGCDITFASLRLVEKKMRSLPEKGGTAGEDLCLLELSVVCPFPAP